MWRHNIQIDANLNTDCEKSSANIYNRQKSTELRKKFFFEKSRTEKNFKNHHTKI